MCYKYPPASLFFNCYSLRVFLSEWHRYMNEQEGSIIFCLSEKQHPFWTERLLSFLFIRGSKSLRWVVRQIFGAKQTNKQTKNLQHLLFFWRGGIFTVLWGDTWIVYLLFPYSWCINFIIILNFFQIFGTEFPVNLSFLC